MLALMKGNKVLREVPEDTNQQLLPGLWSAAVDGWVYEDHALKTIRPADDVPDGFYTSERNIVVTDGVPKYVWTLVPVPDATPE